MFRTIVTLTVIASLTVIAGFLATISPLLPLALGILVALGYLITTSIKKAILVLLLTKPIIDATWLFKIPFVGLNALQIVGSVFPIMILIYLLIARPKLANSKALRLFSIFVVLNTMSYLLFCINSSNTGIEGVFSLMIAYIGHFLQFLNSFAAFIVFPILFKTPKEQKFFFQILILSLIFPLVTGLAQIFGFFEGRVLRTTGDLQRISGLYYDSSNMRMYSLQALAIIFIYFSYFLKTTDKYYKSSVTFLLIAVPLFLLIIYYGYSKAAISILIIWLLCYMILNNKILIGIIIIFIFGMTYLTNDTIQIEIEKLLYKEIKYTEGTLNPEHEYTLLGGRIARWQMLIDDFLNRDLSEQLIGFRFNVGIIAHNDWIRILVSNGVIGLISFIVFVSYVFYKLIAIYMIYRDGFSTGAIMIFFMFIIDSIGLVPLLYPGYCWYTFGILSLALNRPMQKNLNVSSTSFNSLT
ncbi:hypothetical protein L6Q79_08365 [bacterium]|nr:hypothetical protein [bacterium]NUN46808.1 hypothetical protein [bacterium]